MNRASSCKHTTPSSVTLASPLPPLLVVVLVLLHAACLLTVLFCNSDALTPYALGRSNIFICEQFAQSVQSLKRLGLFTVTISILYT